MKSYFIDIIFYEIFYNSTKNMNIQNYMLYCISLELVIRQVALTDSLLTKPLGAYGVATAPMTSV
jgi:hypothetical protein